MSFSRNFRLLAGLIATLLIMAGCGEQKENVGGLPNKDVAGYVLNGTVINANVTLVGIDANGQPQRDENGSFVGQTSTTDDVNGKFDSAISGAYSGALLVVVEARQPPFTDKYTPTKIRCVWIDGCQTGQDSEGNPITVAYSEFYDAPQDLELWALVPTVSDGQSIYVTMLTHLAAKLAYTEFVTDGSNCTEDNCVGTLPVDGMITTTGAHKANDHVRDLFGLNAYPAQIEPWSPFLNNSNSDSAQFVHQGVHGLLSQALERKIDLLKLDGGLTWQAALDSIVSDIFLTHQGQFYEQHETEFDLDELFTLANQQATAASSLDNLPGVQKAIQAQTTLQTWQGMLGENTLTKAVGTASLGGLPEYLDDTRDFIQKIQTWFSGGYVDSNGDGVITDEDTFHPTGLEDGDTTLFLGETLTAELNNIESKWAIFQTRLAPELGMFFQPMAKFAEYALTCVRSGLSSNNCDTNHEYHSLATYNAESKTLSIKGQSISGYNGKTATANLVAVIDKPNEGSDQVDGDLFYRITFSETATMETTGGKVTVSELEGTSAGVVFALNEGLQANTAPNINAMTMVIPNLLVQSKVPGTDTLDSFAFEAKKMAVEAVATNDALADGVSFNTTVGEWVCATSTADNVVSKDNCGSEKRFNLSAVELPGIIRTGSAEDSDQIEVGLNIISTNSASYYPNTVWPELNLKFDLEGLSNFGLLNGSDFSNTQLSGWLETNPAVADANLVDGKLQDKVAYVEFSDYNQLDTSLKSDVLKLDDAHSVEFGALSYPGGLSGVVLYKQNETDTTKYARECKKVDGTWGCFSAIGAKALGCQANESLGDVRSDLATISINDVMSYLRDQNCLPQVQIDGLGTLQIVYQEEAGNDKDGDGILTTDDSSDLINFTHGQTFDSVLVQNSTLGVESMNLRMITRFKDGAENRELVMFNVLAAAPDQDSVTLGVSLTQDYRGYGNLEAIGLTDVVPFGKRTIWLAVGEQSELQLSSNGVAQTETDTAAMYYFQDDSITLAIKAFDNNQDNDNSTIGYIRYAGILLATIHQEGNVFVVRYIDGTWQLL